MTNIDECVFCRKKYSGFGNPAMPLRAGRCCDKCNILVIMARLDMIHDKAYLEAIE